MVLKKALGQDFTAISVSEKPGPLKSKMGMTLIEILVSLAVSTMVIALALATFKDVNHAARKNMNWNKSGLDAQSFFKAFTNNIMMGKGVISCGEKSITLLNLHGDTLRYQWEDSVITINENPLPIKIGEMMVAELKIEPMGPEKPSRELLEMETNGYWDLDSLDSDKNGQIDFDELDRNRDGIVDEGETRFIALFHIEFTTTEDNKPFIQRATVHPRNHVDFIAALP